MPRRILGKLTLFISGTALGFFICYYSSKQRQLKEWSPINGSYKTKLPSKEETGLPPISIPYGFPGPVNDALQRKAYYVSYNRRLRHPNWAFECITEESLKQGEGVDRKFSKFQQDPDIPEMFSAKLVDYFKSGYDRGHMVPAADARTTQESLDETFYLTNISPQVGNGFNRDYWSFLEEFCRRLVRNEHFSDVYVFTGPAYLPYEENGNWYVKYQLIGNPPNIAVPTHFFKVILASKENDSDSQGRKKYALGSFLIPNQRIPHDDPLEKYVVPLDALERATGLRFFENLNKNDTQPLCEATKCVLIPHPKWVESNNKKLLTNQET